MTSSSPPTTREVATLAVIGGLTVCAALMVLGSRNPLLLVAAPVGTVGLVAAAGRPVLALCIMVVVEFTNLSGLMGPGSGIPIFPASLLLGVLAVSLAMRDPELRSRINGWTLFCAGLLAVFLATQAIATIGSVDVTASFASMYRMTLDCVFVMVVLALIQISARPWTVAAVIVATLAAISILTVINEVVYAGSASFGGLSTVTTASGEGVITLRYGGPLPDSNFWGRHLVMGLPMAAALLTRALRSRRPATITVWLMAVLILLAGVYLTQSRGTFLAAGAAVLAWFLAAERPVRRKGLILLPLSLAVFAAPGVGNRLVAALDDFMQANVQTNIDPSVLARLAAQQEAWMMFGERPVFGFGPATFQGQVINFAGRVPSAVLEPTIAPHNLYAEFAAESGVIGLLGWAVVILGFLAVATLAVMAEPRSGDRALAAAVCAAIIAWSVASIALHMAYFRTFGVVLALAGGLAPMWPSPVEPVRRLVRYTVTWCAAGLVGVAAALAVLGATGSPAVVARQAVTIEPVGPVDGWYSYALDIRSRVEVLPTLATLFDKRGSPVDIIADPVRGLLTFTTTADDPDQAGAEIGLAVAHADTTLHSALRYQQYSLRTVGALTIERTQLHSPIALVAAIATGAGATIALGVALLRIQTRRRIHDLIGRTSEGESPSLPSLNR